MFTPNVNDEVAVTANGKNFHKGIYLGTGDYAGTGHISNKVEVSVNDKKFIDYFITVYPLSKLDKHN